MIKVYLAAAFTALSAPPGELPLTRATLLRDSGAWLRFEGEASTQDGFATFALPARLDRTTFHVQVGSGADWRPVAFSMQTPSGEAAGPTASNANHVNVRVAAKDERVKVRCDGFTNAVHWKPSYQLEHDGSNFLLTMRALVVAETGLKVPDGGLECANARAAVKKEEDRWSDATRYPLSANELAAGSSSFVLFSEKVSAELFVDVELGAMAGEPGVKSAPERVTSVVRIDNRSAKAWPAGELLLTHDGRLHARTTLPHTDAGQSSEVPLGVQVGVSVARDEVELERKTAVVRRETDPPDSVQTAGSATVHNRSGRTLAFRVSKTVSGDASAVSDDAKIIRTPNRIGVEFPLTEIRWKFSLPSGQLKRLTYGTTIRLLLPAEPRDPRP
jgi:hypothetical protein